MCINESFNGYINLGWGGGGGGVEWSGGNVVFMGLIKVENKCLESSLINIEESEGNQSLTKIRAKCRATRKSINNMKPKVQDLEESRKAEEGESPSE
jgi:hypothetical protein